MVFMKKIAISLFLLLTSFFLFAEKAKIHTGDAFAFSLTDYFFPADFSFTGAKCTVTAIKKVEKDVWCLSLAAFRSAQMTAPVVYEYYIKSGDTIKMRRLAKPIEECLIRIESVTWNEVVINTE